MELVDTPSSGGGAFGCAGSSPALSTMLRSSSFAWRSHEEERRAKHGANPAKPTGRSRMTSTHMLSAPTTQFQALIPVDRLLRPPTIPACHPANHLPATPSTSSAPYPRPAKPTLATRQTCKTVSTTTIPQARSTRRNFSPGRSSSPSASPKSTEPSPSNGT